MSTGTMVGCSTGLEPYFAMKYYRSGRLGQNIEVDANIVLEYYDWYYKQNPEADRDVKPPLPPEFVTSMELSPEKHADVQCIIQKHVDSSLSKTVNAPKGYSVEEVETVYERLWRGGAKGGTVYVDGSRDTQVLNLTKKDEKNHEAETEKQPVFVMETIAPIEQTNVTIGNEVGNTCPVCRIGTVEDRGGCNTCSNCNMQLRCGL